MLVSPPLAGPPSEIAASPPSARAPLVRTPAGVPSALLPFAAAFPFCLRMFNLRRQNTIVIDMGRVTKAQVAHEVAIRMAHSAAKSDVSLILHVVTSAAISANVASAVTVPFARAVLLLPEPVAVGSESWVKRPLIDVYPTMNAHAPV